MVHLNLDFGVQAISQCFRIRTIRSLGGCYLILFDPIVLVTGLSFPDNNCHYLKFLCQADYLQIYLLFVHLPVPSSPQHQINDLSPSYFMRLQMPLSIFLGQRHFQFTNLDCYFGEINLELLRQFLFYAEPLALYSGYYLLILSVIEMTQLIFKYNFHTVLIFKL